MIKGVIFDYDGVIGESVDIKTQAFAKIYNEFGEKIVEKVVLHHTSNGGMSRFQKFKLYHKNYLGINLKNRQLNELCFKFSKLIIKDIINAPYVPGSIKFIKSKHKDYDLFISTGTPEDEINKILEKKNIKKYFKSIYGSPANKTDHIKSIIKENNFDNDDLIFIGDADSDILAAKENKLKIIFREHSESISSQKYQNMIKVKNLEKINKIIKLL